MAAGERHAGRAVTDPDPSHGLRGLGAPHFRAAIHRLRSGGLALAMVGRRRGLLLSASAEVERRGGDRDRQMPT